MVCALGFRAVSRLPLALGMSCSGVMLPPVIHSLKAQNYPHPWIIPTLAAVGDVVEMYCCGGRRRTRHLKWELGHSFLGGSILSTTTTTTTAAATKPR